MKSRIFAVIATFGLLTGCTSWVPTVINNGFNYGVNAGRIMSADRSLFNVLNDLTIKNTINNALLDQALQLNVSVDVYQGMVMLTGAVKDLPSRQKAEDLARGVEGVRELYNDIQVTDAFWLRSLPLDLMIENTLATRMVLEPAVSSVNYQVRTSNGVVYVMGISQSRAELDRVIALARASGARKIVSHVFLTEQVALDGAADVAEAKAEPLSLPAAADPAKPEAIKADTLKVKPDAKGSKKKPLSRASSPRPATP
jgi:osmotically-inducible protein OsmY